MFSVEMDERDNAFMNNPPGPLRTPRLRLVPSTAALTRLEIDDPSGLGRVLGASIPAEWPPEQLAEALPWFCQCLTDAPALCGWLGWYGIWDAPGGTAPPVLVGSGGFLGPPDDGRVEVGYSVLSVFQDQGFATEIVETLAGWALTQPAVVCVLAETGADNPASLRVLAKAGFLATGPGRTPGMLGFERR